MKTIAGAEIFATGVNNGQRFTTADLDGIVTSFDALGLAGRIPLKLTHDGPDARTDPESRLAFGWVQRIWRDGDKLLADLEVPDNVAGMISEGQLRFVSVELLRNVRADTRIIPWVLDAVALLGADQPAVGTLAPLAANAQRAALSFESRTTFSRGGLSEMDEVQKLKRDFALEILNGAVREGRILPRDVSAFTKRFGDEATPEVARAWISDTPKPQGSQAFGRVNGRSSDPDDVVRTGDAGQLVAAAVTEFMEQRAAAGRPVTYDAAVVQVFRRDPALAESYKQFALGNE